MVLLVSLLGLGDKWNSHQILPTNCEPAHVPGSLPQFQNRVGQMYLMGGSVLGHHNKNSKAGLQVSLPSQDSKPQA
jgi:hypothetical protein